jgi:hypothetical protein
VKARLSLCATLFWLSALPAYSQWKELPDRTTLAGQAGLGPTLIVKLLNSKVNALNHKAVIEVQTDGVKLVNPAAVNYEPRFDEAHIQYRLDSGPIQDTTSNTWTFENVSTGEHLLRVALATSDGHQLGRQKSLKLKVP